MFKHWAQYLNGRSVEKVLMRRECINLTLRLLLNGAFEYDEPVLSTQMWNLHKTCPILTNHLLPSSEKWDIVEEASINVLQPDSSHISPKATLCVRREDVEKELDLPLWPEQLQEGLPFVQKLREAYRVDYEDPHITSLGSRPLQYFSRFSFIDPSTRHRVTFKAGNCFTVRGKSICRFEVGFVHEKIQGEARLFAIVSDIKECGTEDPVLQLPQMRVVHNSQGIVGLPGIGSNPVFIVSINQERKQAASVYSKGPLSLDQTARRGEVDLGLRGSSAATLVHCWWDVGVM
ncbi:hypothetical protein GMDG_07278 [Pseudogymnoascus destructans 20631-21]|uniref:Uncharacterized protein n=1 Tax=Pseudogymnoascus destructans (strain ATCC MYA-4855 / 20631-21) TaxID=658429 RepID=L8FWH2_PSED2|nr:hypothetical protein GMDG_07278 [Pseudogymnoascus destructans 20631-21]